MAPPQGQHRRWTVITSGILVGALALIVTFTSRAAFLSPVAVAVVAAVGVMALMLQLRLQHPRRAEEARLPSRLNLAGGVLALTAFLRDWLHIPVSIAELITLAAISCFGVSGALILHNIRKRRAPGRPGN